MIVTGLIFSVVTTMQILESNVKVIKSCYKICLHSASSLRNRNLRN